MASPSPAIEKQVAISHKETEHIYCALRHLHLYTWTPPHSYTYTHTLSPRVVHVFTIMNGACKEWIPHGGVHWGPAELWAKFITQTHSQQLAWVCAGAFSLYLRVCRITFTWRVQGAWQITRNPSSTAPRPVFSLIGADTWQTLSRFHVWENIDMKLPAAVWVAPQMSFHYLWVPHRCFGGFRAVTHEGLGSLALLGCLAGLWKDFQKFLFEIRLPSVSGYGTFINLTRGWRLYGSVWKSCLYSMCTVIL